MRGSLPSSHTQILTTANNSKKKMSLSDFLHRLSRSKTMDSLAPYIPYALSALVAAGTAFYFVSQKKGAVLDPKNFKNFKLVEKIVISPNTALYRFALPHKDAILGLPIGQHISVMAEINGKEITRSYTPTSSDEDRGHFDLLIKSYPTGNISKLFGELKVGDSVAVRGPKGNFNYTPNLVRAFGMIAGGTGITPMLQIIRAICRNPQDKTVVNLIFANVNEEDILLKKELDELAAAHDNFNVYYVLNNPPAGWKGGVGFVTPEMIREHLPAPAKDVKILLCGPPPMIKAMSTATLDLGFEKSRAVSKLEDQVFKF